MASQPGILTEWPWAPLGSFKYIILAPWVVHGAYQFMAKGPGERDLSYFIVFPFLLSRVLHNQIWISLSRHRTAKGKNRILDRGIEFEQVDRESNWDDQIILNGILLYIGLTTIPSAAHLPFWRAGGVLVTILLHAGPVEFLYYWLHRALHHHFLYSRYHSHHHSSIVTEPITSVIHPFAEHLAYFTLFAIPILATVYLRTASIVSFVGYISYIDLMNNMGHCNFEIIPRWLFIVFPPIKYLMYTPSFHSLHHTQFRTNYSLFMPFYDYIYGTMDTSSDSTYETSLQKSEDSPDVVHLTHLTNLHSIYHLRLGLASLASRPQISESMWLPVLLWPITVTVLIFTWVYDQSVVLERNSFNKFNLQSWVLPRFNVHYLLKDRKEAINTLIEKAILDANEKGARVLSLGVLNQAKKLNGYGELYVKRHKKLRLKLVDGSSLAAAIVVKSIPKGTTRVMLCGNLNKVAFAIANALCRIGIQLFVANKDTERLKAGIDGKYGCTIVSTTTYSPKVWIVGDGLTEAEQLRASPGTIFMPFSPFPPKQIRKDCFYHVPPAMLIPSAFKNMHSCENWLGRRLMSAWRIAGIIHAMEGWEGHECGQIIFDIEMVWEAALRHGFHPVVVPNYLQAAFP
ncbi:hypothetical protein SAY87_006073 [Trapa incisa]|uniref:Uncharacterized protein n=1 Tax=Trapa incisa TaxID=236973 RepID=A0AAN7QCP5_9MYRT|nr:hypothetical protein SAY87_006073 [Trapa incisa]